MKKLKYIEVICVPKKGDWLSQYREGANPDDALRKDASELIEQIKRHCDHFQDISPKPYFECSFCNSEWEETYSSDYKTFLPACCSKAEAEALSKLPVEEFKKP